LLTLAAGALDRAHRLLVLSQQFTRLGLAQRQLASHISGMMPIQLLSVAIGIVCVVLIAVISMGGPPDPGGKLPP
jgi:hypothetical protein